MAPVWNVKLKYKMQTHFEQKAKRKTPSLKEKAPVVQWETSVLGRKKATPNSNSQRKKYKWPILWPMKNLPFFKRWKEMESKLPHALMKPTKQQLKTDRSQCQGKQERSCAAGRGTCHTPHGAVLGASSPLQNCRGSKTTAATEHHAALTAQASACGCWGGASNALREKKDTKLQGVQLWMIR